MDPKEAIVPPPSAEDIVQAQQTRGMWPLSKEAQVAMVEKGMKNGKLFPRRMFDAALKLEMPRLVPTIIAGEIEQRAKVAELRGETFKVRLPMPNDIRNSKRKKVFRMFEIPITRDLLYHMLLGIKAPPLELLADRPEDAKPAEPAPVLFGADGVTPLKPSSE